MSPPRAKAFRKSRSHERQRVDRTSTRWRSWLHVIGRLRFYLKRSNCFRRAVRWFVPAAALALTPKCLLCVAAYAGLGAALGLGGPEFCGASSGPGAPWKVLIAAVGFALGAITVVMLRRRVQAKNASAIA